MAQDKYSGYWKVKGQKSFYKILGKSSFPRWRVVYRYIPGVSKYNKIYTTTSVDYLRLYCEKISEKEFKYYING